MIFFSIQAIFNLMKWNWENQVKRCESKWKSLCNCCTLNGNIHAEQNLVDTTKYSGSASARAPVYFDMFILVICLSDIIYSTLHSMRIKQQTQEHTSHVNLSVHLHTYITYTNNSRRMEFGIICSYEWKFNKSTLNLHDLCFE